MTTTSDLGGRSGTFYPSPYYDIARSYLPKNMRDMIRWCQFYLDNNPIIQQAVRRMSSYPITKLIPNIEEEARRVKAEKVVNDLKLRDFCMSIAMHYFAFGNAFISVIPAYSRVYVCSSCKAEVSSRTIEKFEADDILTKNGAISVLKISNRSKEKRLELIKCPMCHKEKIPVDVKDKPKKNLYETEIVIWHPLNIRIDFNPISNKSQYRFVMPKSLRDSICRGDIFLINSTPKIFVDAAVKNKDIIMNSDALHHICRTSINSETGWGHPIIQGSLRELFHAQIIKKASEALALQHIVPMKILYPKDISGGNVLQNLDLGRWKNKVLEGLKDWRRDPNHILLLPTPAGVDYIGGQHSGLDPSVLLEKINEEIIIGMGVPKEFMIGGTSFSGSSIALRMLENDFLNLRTLLSEFLNDFLLPILVKSCDIDNFTVKFSSLRTADDVQQKDLAIRLMESDKLSISTVLEELGFDSDKELKKIIEEKKAMADVHKRLAAEEGGLGGEISNIEFPVPKNGRISTRAYIGETGELLGYFADMIARAPRDAQAAMLTDMQSSSPRIYGAVTDAMSQMGHKGVPIVGNYGREEKNGKNSSKSKKPLPDQKPPRRNNSPV